METYRQVINWEIHRELQLPWDSTCFPRQYAIQLTDMLQYNGLPWDNVSPPTTVSETSMSSSETPEADNMMIPALTTENPATSTCLKWFFFQFCKWNGLPDVPMAITLNFRQWSNYLQFSERSMAICTWQHIFYLLCHCLAAYILYLRNK